MHTAPPTLGYLLLAGLAFFFGLAYEDFYGRDQQTRPGGVRTFPLLAVCGAVLYQLDPLRLIPLTGGLLVVGLWLAVFYFQHIRQPDEGGKPNAGLIVPVCNMLAFLLGPAALSQPPWVAVGATVAGVLLLTQRERLHAFAHDLEIAEIITAGKFLIVTGLVLPLLPDAPVTQLTTITPHQVWLAVVAVSTVSYVSYLLQRYAIPNRATELVGLLGGLYSSTVTTVVLARRIQQHDVEAERAISGIMLATAVMYLRLLAIVAVFNFDLALRLAPATLGLAALAFAVAGAWHVACGQRVPQATSVETPRNPLEFGIALTFAAAFIVISFVTTWVRGHFGAAGVYSLAAVVGIADIDPFVLNVAQNGSADMSAQIAVGAILIAVSSNNILKAGYAIFIAGFRNALPAVVALVLFAAAGGAAVLWGLPG